jgi:hypothetical protein
MFQYKLTNKKLIIIKIKFIIIKIKYNKKIRIVGFKN